MKLSIRAGLLALIGLCCSPLLMAKPYPLEYFALRDVVSNVVTSPDGEHLALLKIPTRDGDAVLEIYQTEKLVAGNTASPFRVSADPMEIMEADWVSDTHLLLSLRQRVRDRIKGFNQGAYSEKLALLDVSTKQLKELDDNGAIENLLPGQAGKVLISTSGTDRRVKAPAQFRPRNYYELDLDSGSRKLLVRGSPERLRVFFNAEGKPWLSIGIDAATGALIWFHRKPDQSWREIYRGAENSFEQFRVVGFDQAVPNTLFVIANNGFDKAALWEFDAATKKFGEAIYRRNDVDVLEIANSSLLWRYPDHVVAVEYFKDRRYRAFLDSNEEATVAQLEQLIPEAFQLDITSRSRDGQTLTVANQGPTDPGTHYLLKNGRLLNIGSSQPLLAAKNLSEVNYITYSARDGKKIPAFVTTPKGQGPFPLVVLPHGGPFIHQRVVYHEWSQMLANQGYMVLQPQFRGSKGYGLDFYTTAFIDGGQGGDQMQDDKDDGALHLVREGLVDPDRVAMFGWSYGGYAALIAASRSPQIYQCAIAGAAVADNQQQVNYYRNQIRGTQRLEQLNFWEGSRSPIELTEQVNIPLLMLHGTIDQRVPIAHSVRYRKAIGQDKSLKYVELDGADHFLRSLYYEHQIELYRNLIDFLKNDCGPGGL